MDSYYLNFINLQEHLKRKIYRYNDKKNKKRKVSFNKVRGFMDYVDAQSLTFRKKSVFPSDPDAWRPEKY